MLQPTRRGPNVWHCRPRLPENHALPVVYRVLAGGDRQAKATGELARDERLALVEAALFAADEPLPLKKLVAVCHLLDAAEARRLLKKLQHFYDHDGTAFQVVELAGGFQLLTRLEFHPWLVRHRRAAVEAKLSAPMRETLTIVAYRQPIMRADVENVRGVHSGELLRQLMEKGLIRIAGRDDSLGRPVLYGTTRKFLQLFGLRTLKDLPQVDQLRPPEKDGDGAS